MWTGDAEVTQNSISSKYKKARPQILNALLLATLLVSNIWLLNQYLLLDKRSYNNGYVRCLKDQLIIEQSDLRDPTFNETIFFLDSDKTDLKRYSEYYNCVDFTRDLRNNAVEIGYSCGFVLITLEPLPSHAIVCFNTIDNGLIFIEPQNDEVVTLHIGDSYGTLGIIIDFDIIW